MGSENRKSPFTILEIVVVIALVALIASVVTLQISKALKGERFEQGVDHLIAKFALAQELMLDFHTDVRLYLDQEGDVLKCTLVPNLPLPSHFEPSMNRYREIKGISGVAFDERVKTNHEFLFDGTVGSTPKGRLTLIGKGREENIILNGYPSHIKRGKAQDAPKQINQALYPEEILSAL